MASVARDFWLVVVPLLVGFTALGLLGMAAAFPTHLFPVTSAGFALTALVAAVALSVLAWQVLIVQEQVVGGLDGEE